MTILADDKCCVIQFAAMESSPGTRPILPEPAPQTVEVLQAATRVLAGAAPRSIEVPDGSGDRRQFRTLAVLADPWRARSAQMTRAPCWRHRW